MALSTPTAVAVLVKVYCVLCLGQAAGCGGGKRAMFPGSWLICVGSSSRRVPYLQWDCKQDCPAVQNSSWQFRWINPFQSIALLWAAIKLSITWLEKTRGMVLERAGRGGVWCVRPCVCVKGNLFFTSQANHFETRGIMLQNRSYSIKSSVELQPLLLEGLALLALWGSSGKETISTLSSSQLK